MTNSPQESDDADLPSFRLRCWICGTLIVAGCILAYLVL